MRPKRWSGRHLAGYEALRFSYSHALLRYFIGAGSPQERCEVKVSSNVGAAKEAVHGFAGVHSDAANCQVPVATSSVSGMEAGMAVANGPGDRLDGLVSAAKAQADRVTALATGIQRRESSTSWSGARSGE
jgi:hypothetical protein